MLFLPCESALRKDHYQLSPLQGDLQSSNQGNASPEIPLIYTVSGGPSVHSRSVADGQRVFRASRPLGTQLQSFVSVRQYSKKWLVECFEHNLTGPVLECLSFRSFQLVSFGYCFASSFVPDRDVDLPLTSPTPLYNNLATVVTISIRFATSLLYFCSCTTPGDCIVMQGACL